MRRCSGTAIEPSADAVYAPYAPTLELACAILLEATLSFLGLGVQPPTSPRCGMVHEGPEQLDPAWWISTAPGIVLMLTSIVVSRTGDWLRDLLAEGRPRVLWRRTPMSRKVAAWTPKRTKGAAAMRGAARTVIAIGSFLTLLVGGMAGAQDKPADDMEVLREKLRADKKVVVASVLGLTEGEAKVFWPVYNAYQSDMVSHYDRLLKLIDTYAKAYDTMTDETATTLLKQYLTLERDHVALLTGYLPRFSKVLPPRKVARLYQIENKARALVNYELARGIPLVK